MRRILLTGGSGFIGTNLLEAWSTEGISFMNLDLSPPLNPSHGKFWHKADLLDPNAWLEQARAFDPTEVIHLAARTEMDETTTPEVGYRVNVEGTRQLLDASSKFLSLRRLILVSSQFVCGPGHLPCHDEDFAPATVYGRSKVLAEQMLRKTSMSCPWVIVRPTNVWGPWHPRYPREFWRVLQKGWYFHPAGGPVQRAYVYVENLLQQMKAALENPAVAVAGRVFYLSDPVEDISSWVDEFSLALRGAPARRIPRSILFGLGRVGDQLERLGGRPFYLNSSRARSMTTDYPVPLEKGLQTLGIGSVTLPEGVRRTVAWLRQNLPKDFPSSAPVK
jgi:nucleoside-diphosphate-sugar epimerase